MNFKIVADSCCDLNDKFEYREKIELIPLTLTVNGEDIVDDSTFNQKSFLEKVTFLKPELSVRWLKKPLMDM